MSPFIDNEYILKYTAHIEELQVPWLYKLVIAFSARIASLSFAYERICCQMQLERRIVDGFTAFNKTETPFDK